MNLPVDIFHILNIFVREYKFLLYLLWQCAHN
ncbi:unnamed protein product [Spirodela intermedia]|uniref:Uncharacterized protein n=1 Tax=Spirodela intermedia TaxID=51605 RepID=A0A7I8KCJ8_SPIIN|nr:unnamed protein product [Spirodela intermedia]